MEGRTESTYLYNQQGNAVFDPIIALRHRADQGDAESQYQFGLAFDSYLTTTFQPPEESYLRRAAEQNHPAAAREYANRVRSTYYDNARGFFSVRPSFEDAEIFFRRAATNGDAQAAISYAELFSKPPVLIAGENGSSTPNPILQRDAVRQMNDMQDALHCLRPYAENGNASARMEYAKLTFELARRVEESELPHKLQDPYLDVAEAVGFLDQAAAQGMPQARYDYAMLVINTYQGENSIWPDSLPLPDYAQAEQYLRAAARGPSSNSEARQAYAHMWLSLGPLHDRNGQPIPNPLAQRPAEEQSDNKRLAMNYLYGQATQQRDTQAQYRYVHEIFLQDPFIDAAEGVEFLGQAAEQGMPQAQYDYAMLVVNTYQGGNSLWPDSLPLPDYAQAEQYLRAAALEPLNSEARQAYAHVWLSLGPLRDRNGQTIPNPLAQRPAEEQLANKRLAMGYLYDQATRQRDTHAQYRYAYQVLVNNKTENINPRADGRDATTVRNEALELLREAADRGHPWARMDYGYELLQKAPAMKIPREEGAIETIIKAYEEAENYLAPANPPGN